MIAVELGKLLRRPRTWAMVGLLAGLPVLVALFIKATDVAPRPGTGPAFLSQVLTNGTLLPVAALAIVIPLFLPVTVAVVAGDAVAGEAAAGTLRYYLVRPVARGRLLLAKLVAVVAFVLLAVVAVAVVNYVAGALLFGAQPLPTTSGGPPLSTQDAALRVVESVLYVGWSMLGVACLALLFSTLTDSGLAAALGAVAVLIASGVLDGLLEPAAAVRPYLPTHYWFAFIDLFRDPPQYYNVGRGVGLQAAYVGLSLLAAWANFTSKDVTS